MSLSDPIVVTKPISATNMGTQVAQCGECDRSFKNDWALKVHKVRKHSGRKWVAGVAGAKLKKQRNGVKPKSKKTKVVTKATRQVVFCPVCGTNVHVIQQAINLGG